MIPRIVIPEQEYLGEFRKYVYGLALKWLGVSPEMTDPAAMMDTIAEASKNNYRALYLTYLLPIADERYKRMADNGTLRGITKLLLNMRLNGLPYNDFMLMRFCGIVLHRMEAKIPEDAPLPEDYKDLQKLIWTFVQQFRKKAEAIYPTMKELV